jgi:peptidoglycan/xylan/chitin deacetylase (PgdA/CDA1 family)
MSAKHKLKLFLREAYARTLFHTGLHRLVDRAMPRRLTILMGHCVDAPEHNAHFPRDMKLGAAKLEAWLRLFARDYEVVTVADGWQKIQQPAALPRSLVALSMDDGYADNRTHLLPLLQKLGVSATIYLEERPLESRRINWTHKLFWTLDRTGTTEYIRRYGEISSDRATCEKLSLAAHDGRALYQLKRVLKYEAEPGDRERSVDQLFRERSGDEAALAQQMYMSWEQARELEAAGVELGVHTLSHAILSRLDKDAQRAEIQGCQERMAERLNAPARTLAYPWGRRWDYNADSCALAEERRFECAVSSHAGTNDARSKRWELRRIAIDEDAQLHLLVTEACGGFDLLRKFGIDWSE